MPAEMILNRATQIAVLNGKAYRAYAWYTDDDKPFFLVVAGKTPLTLEDIGDEYFITRQRPLCAAFRRAYFPFASQLVDEVREKQAVAYCAVGLTEEAVEVDTTPTLQVSARSVRPASPWPALWASVLDCTVPGYSQAEGTQTGHFEGVASLPNLLLGGIDPNLETLKGLGFTIECDEQARIRLEGARKRFERERLPLRLDPVEMLAYYDEGWHTAVQTVAIGRHTIHEGQRYHLTLRWQRATEHVKSELPEPSSG